MTLRFILPPAQANVGRYSTYDTPSGLVIHGSLGAAKNALRGRSWDAGGVSARDSYILENVGGEWFILYAAKKGQRFPWLREVTDWFGSTGRLRARQMTNDEYANWRLQVERERMNIGVAPPMTFGNGTSTLVQSIR